MLIAIVLLAVLAAALGRLIFVGLHFAGPFRGLAAERIMRKYSARKRQGEIVFYGASNFTLWADIERDLSPYRVQNHGFGGSTDKDLAHYADRLRYPYQPTVVVFQTGSNDYVLASGTDEEKLVSCMAFKERMFAEFHEKLPSAVFVVMGGLLLPGRSQYEQLTMRVNRQLRALCGEREYMRFIDSEKLTYDGVSYRTDLFRKDQIHLNREGQKKWADEYILPALAKAARMGEHGGALVH